MTDWRRACRPGGTYFFTLVSEGRKPIFTTEIGRATLRVGLKACRERWPFSMPAIVLMPDHVHMLWSLPETDSDYPRRMAWLAAGGEEQWISGSRRSDRRRGVLQRRYWEHLILDERDYERLFDYIHFNPVKHGHVAWVADWPRCVSHRLG